MKPQEIGAELAARLAVPEPEKIAGIDNDEVQAAVNEQAARLCALFERLDVIPQESYDRMVRSGDYDGPEFKLHGGEVTLDEINNGSSEMAYHSITKARAVEFYLPMSPEAVGLPADVVESVTCNVLIGYNRREDYDIKDGKSTLGQTWWNIEAATTLMIDKASTAPSSESGPLEAVVDDFVVLERTDMVSMFMARAKFLPSQGELPADKLYTVDANSYDYDQAEELLAYRQDTVPGLQLLESFDIDGIEAAIIEIEQAVAQLAVSQ
ncbi:MAG: hypothetical protein JWM81_967 [Candidatus Saccharibacteria bacterium]|nr:hypothetical protein [Candidatus Saccharibacteria bacterium]